MDWQPIAKAPKDGTTILAALRYRDGGACDPLTIRWHEPWGQWVLAGCLIGIQNNAKNDENLDPYAFVVIDAPPSMSACQQRRTDMIEINEGSPPMSGSYVAYVNDDADPKMPAAAKAFLQWHDGRWWYPLSTISYRGQVYGWVGPLPVLPLED